MREIADLIITELRGSWRFRWFAVLLAWVFCAGGWAFVYLMPDSYESSASVLFDTTSDFDQLLAKMTVNTDILSRVEMIRIAMLSRSQLEKVARETDLHLRAKSDSEMDAVIAGMHSNIEISTDRQRGANIYKITYRDYDARTAYAVVGTLLNIFVEETLGANRKGNQRAQEFLRNEISNLEADLTLAENSLAEFKRQNMGRMPGEQGDYFARLQAEMNFLESTQTELRQVRRRRESLRQQLSGEQPSVDAVGPQSEIDQRIADNQRRLEELQLRFTDMHPDVVATKSTLEQLNQQKRQQTEALLDSAGLGATSDNPVFQNIQIELTRANSDIASLEEKESTHQRKIAELQSLVDILPDVEAELSRLNRDYSVKQAQYRSLLQRLEVAELSESVEKSEDVKFQVINPPRIPLSPVAPNRPLLLAMVLFASLGAGAGIAFLGNQLKPVFTDPKTVRSVVGYPVLGTIQALDTSARRSRRIAQIAAFAASLGVLCFVFVVIFWFEAPLSRMVRSLV